MKRLGRFTLVTLALWAPLTVLGGYGIAACGAGSTDSAYVLAGCAFCGLLLTPVLLFIGRANRAAR